uniref:Uncharacterized protein n=1 Tax=Heterorhabditis bacteriophora TaxID=37862 RepID=A0A1I7WKK5_HETBA
MVEKRAIFSGKLFFYIKFFLIK